MQDIGKLLTETAIGDHTDLTLRYTYDSQTHLPTAISGSNGRDAFRYTTHYNDYYEIASKTETSAYLRDSTVFTFDGDGRPHSVERYTTPAITGAMLKTKIRHAYEASSGIQTALYDESTQGSSQLLWQIEETNPQNMATKMTLGNDYQMTHRYDANVMPERFTHRHKDRTGGAYTALDMSYTI